MHLSIERQAKEIYEEQATPDLDEVADACGLDVNTIRSILIRVSKKYRRDSREGSGQDITLKEFNDINLAYLDLARSAESETVKERALSRLRDEFRGRLPAQIANTSPTLNVNIIAQQITLARQRLEEDKSKAKEVIDV